MSFDETEKEMLTKVLAFIEAESRKELEETFHKTMLRDANKMWAVRGIETVEHLLRRELDKL